MSYSGDFLIAQERGRQVREEGFTAEHDDENWDGGQLVMAAACYALGEDNGWLEKNECGTFELWPWDYTDYKPDCDRVHELAKAGALIAAEIDRLQRQQTKMLLDGEVRLEEPVSRADY
jgi:hypothetical protein